MRLYRVLLLLTIPAGALWAQDKPVTASAPASQSGLDLGAIDKSVNPCQDFYQYSCGLWLKNNPIPADQASWGRFDELHERNQVMLRNVAEDSMKHRSRSALDQKVGDFYAACMDTSELDKLGDKPLRPELDRIAAISSKAGLVDEVIALHKLNVNAFFSFDSSPDPNDARIEIAGLDQGGLGLPERDYYFRTDAKSVELRKQYVAHVTKMFQLIGIPAAEAAKKADTVLAIETELAKGSLDVTSRRDPTKLVHKYKTADLAALTPAFDLHKYFVGLDTPAFSTLNVAVPDFFRAMNSTIENRSLDELKDYLAWQYTTSRANKLAKPFLDETFDFYGRILTGAEKQRPRWKRCVASTDGYIGEAIGQRYVEQTFGKEGKQRTLDMVHQIERAMSADIDAITWMSDDTKKEAFLKLKGVTNKIGYPDKWRDYSTLTIRPGDYVGNVNRADAFEVARHMRRIGQPVDRNEWEMTPPTVNAYYDPQQNNINFPAGILQPPFYSNKADDAVNAGAIGAVIGHELTHGFDDEGRQFDADGNLRDWWRKQDEEAFNKLADCLVKEYSSFSPLPGVHLNGKLTLGENTADNGGMRLSYTALMNSLIAHAEEPNSVDGYTTAQRFFLGFGQVWCDNIRPELERLYAQTDPHSPPRFRVNGVVKNMEAFTEAWHCKPGSDLFVAKGDACRVW